ncbi:MAG: response regulator, partial [Selenomonadaceae bacterium]|nr:response regulator [Selenomonadaceae bacterium]
KPLAATNALYEFRQAFSRKRQIVPEKKLVELEGRRILMAEDMPVNAEILMMILEMRGMISDHAENGKIAVEKFAASPKGFYDAVLMDIRMPVMDGLEAAAAIRALDHPDAKTVPIIAMTANAFDEDVQRSLNAGMNAHLTKPADPEQLYKTLQELIRD